MLRPDTRDAAAIGGLILLAALASPLALEWIRGSLRTDPPGAAAELLPGLVRGLALSGFAATLATAVGVSLALSLWRLPRPTKRALWLLCFIPIFLPSYLHATAWQFLLDGGGTFGTVLGDARISRWYVNESWRQAVMMMVSGAWLLPIPLSLTGAALERLDYRAQEAAVTRWHPAIAALRIHARALSGPILLAWCVAFSLAFSDFPIPDLFQISTYSTELFARTSAGSTTVGPLTTTLPSASLALLLILLTWRAMTGLDLSLADARTQPWPLLSGPRKWALLALALLMTAVFVILPLANLASVAQSGAEVYFAARASALDSLSSLCLSLTVAIVTTGLAFLLTSPSSNDVRSERNGLRYVAWLVFLTPTPVVGMSLLHFWNSPLWPEQAISWGLGLISADILHWLIVPLVCLRLARRQLPEGATDGAYASGLGWWKTVRHIELPLCAPWLWTSIALVFLLVLSEATLALFLAPAGLPLLPGRIYSYIHYGPDEAIAAMLSWQLILSLSCVALFVFVIGRRRHERND